MRKAPEQKLQVRWAVHGRSRNTDKTHQSINRKGPKSSPELDVMPPHIGAACCVLSEPTVCVAKPSLPPKRQCTKRLSKCDEQHHHSHPPHHPQLATLCCMLDASSVVDSPHSPNGQPAMQRHCLFERQRRKQNGGQPSKRRKKGLCRNRPDAGMHRCHCPHLK